MSEYKAIETTDLVKIANAIRLKKGGTDKISLEDMPAMIREIEGGGVKLPALTNEAAASELLAGKQLINDEGDVITGAMADNGTIASTMDGLNTKQVTIPAGYTSGGTVSLDNTIDNEVDIQADLLAQAVAALEGKAGGGSEPSLQSKSVTPSAAQQTVVPDSGYDGLSKVTVNAMPTATQATPSISVNSSGLITASATQSAGYVSAGTKSATKQLTTQAAKTITPSTSQQTAVAKGVYTTGAVTVNAIPSTYVKPTATKTATTYTPTTSNQTIAAGTYCSGAQTIKGDANLKAENIAEGVSIFGVTGTHSGGSSGVSMDTCTVTITDLDGFPLYTVTTVIENNAEVPYVQMADISDTTSMLRPPFTIQNVKCGAVITIFAPESQTPYPYMEVDGGATFINSCRASWVTRSDEYPLMFVFTAPETAGANATILVSYQ